MANVRYAKWLLRVTVPADEHAFWRVFDVTAPDDELFLLQTFLPMHNPDMRIIGEPMMFDNMKDFEAKRTELDAEMKQQPNWKPSGKLDSQLTQERMEKIKQDRDEALSKARGPHKKHAASLATKPPATSPKN